MSTVTAGAVAAPAIPVMNIAVDPDGGLDETLAAVREVACAGAFTLGRVVEDFEREFAAYCGTSEAVGVSSGTDALALTLRALGIGPGDEVVVPGNSFIATAEAVSAVGATPRLADVDPVSHLITADHLAAVLGPRVRCVIPVHLYGQTVDMGPLLEVARRAGIFVVEDACQAHGAWYQGTRTGALGDAGCFSFYPTKNLGAWGDGGAVTTNDPLLADAVRMLRSHGERVRHRHAVVGGTARLDALQAAVLRIKLRSLDAVTGERRRLGALLHAQLAAQGVPMPANAGEGTDHVYHLFVVRSHARDALRLHLRAAGVETAVHYPKPIHLTEAYAHLGLTAGALPVCEELASSQCTVPLFPGMTAEQLDRVARAVLEAFAAEAQLSGVR